jgi:hypothetical protein
MAKRLLRILRSVGAAILASWVAVFPRPSAAAPITVTGQITSVEYGISGSFSVGQQYTMTFDWVGPGPYVSQVGRDARVYPTAGVSFELSIGPYLINSSHMGYALTNQSLNDAFSFGATYIWTTATSGSPLFGSYLIGDLFPYVAMIELEDPTARALVSADLQGPLPFLPDYASRQLVVRFAEKVTPDVAFGVQSLYGTVDRIEAKSTAIVVSEPSSQALAGAVFLALCAMRRVCIRLAT